MTFRVRWLRRLWMIWPLPWTQADSDLRHATASASPIRASLIASACCSGLVVITSPFVSFGWYFVPVGIAYSTILGFLSVGLALSGRFLTAISLLFLAVVLSATGIWAVLWFEDLGALTLI